MHLRGGEGLLQHLVHVYSAYSRQHGSLPSGSKAHQAGRQDSKSVFFFLGQTTRLQNRLFKLDLNT